MAVLGVQVKKRGRREMADIKHQNCLGQIRANRSLNDLHLAAVEAKVTQKDIVVVFGEILSRVAKQNDQTNEHLKRTRRLGGGLAVDRLAPFEGCRASKAPMEWFLWRIVYFLNRYPKVEPTFFADEARPIAADFESSAHIPAYYKEDMNALSRGLRVLLLALVYIDRISQRYPDSLVTSRSLHRLVLISVFVACKFSDDFSFSTQTFAKLGGIPSKDINRMEMVFCELIGFQLNLTEEEFDAKCLHQLKFAFSIAEQRCRMNASCLQNSNPKHSHSFHCAHTTQNFERQDSSEATDSTEKDYETKEELATNSSTVTSESSFSVSPPSLVQSDECDSFQMENLTLPFSNRNNKQKLLPNPAAYAPLHV